MEQQCSTATASSATTTTAKSRTTTAKYTTTATTAPTTLNKYLKITWNHLYILLLKFHEILMPCFKRKNSEDDFKTKIKWWLCFKKILYKLLGAHINLIIFIGICFFFLGVFLTKKKIETTERLNKIQKKNRASTYVILLLL